MESLSVCSFHFCDILHSQGTVESTVRVSSFIHMVLQNQGQETQFLIPAGSDSGKSLHLSEPVTSFYIVSKAVLPTCESFSLSLLGMSEVDVEGDESQPLSSS